MVEYAGWIFLDARLMTVTTRWCTSDCVMQCIYIHYIIYIIYILYYIILYIYYIILYYIVIYYTSDCYILYIHTTRTFRETTEVMSLANPAASWGFANDDLHFMVKSRPIRQDSIMICLKTRFPVTQKRPVIMFPIIIAI